MSVNHSIGYSTLQRYAILYTQKQMESNVEISLSIIVVTVLGLAWLIGEGLAKLANKDK